MQNCRNRPEPEYVCKYLRELPQKARYKTRTLIYGWIAARFGGVVGEEMPKFFKKQFGVQVSVDTIERAVRPVREPRLASKSTETDGGEYTISSRSVTVDERSLGLRTFLIRVPNDGLALDDLFAALDCMPGIRQLIETQEDREIIGIALLTDDEKVEDLRARILEHVPDHAVRVHEIRRESHRGAAATWLKLTNWSVSEEGE